MFERPRGTVSFLFTDLEEGERLWRDSPAAMPTAYARHDAILRQAIAGHGGHLYKVAGDALQVAFPTAPAAVAAALDAQLALQTEPWSSNGLLQPLRVRMALHAGSVEPDAAGDYRSPVLNRLGRLLEAAHGGQVLLTAAVHGLVWDELPAGAGLRDLGETRLKDLDEPSRVYQLLHPDLPATFPPLRSGGRPTTNLPAQLTVFVGRDAEIITIQELLRREHVRLVTLTGPGGIGKSRLSLQAAAGLLPEFADGVWLVELASISDPALAPAAIAAAVGVRESVSTGPWEVVRTEMAGKRALLLLDNFEHLMAAAPLLPELMTACPHVKILVTSRVALHMRGEYEVPVAPLSLPRRQPPPTLEQLTQYEAVQLFAERARAVRPDFAIDNASAPAVAEICHRLDGLPLAIELAAARIRFLSPEALHARLERRLELLKGGARDLPERQRALRQTIAWSYDLLPGAEKALFRALAVFAGSFSFQAAEEVAGATLTENLGILEGLESLVDNSLLRFMASLEVEPRFQMLETIREYGLEQLALNADEEFAARRAHAASLANLVIGMRKALATGVGKAIATFDAERDNVRAMLVWLLETGDAETALWAAACFSEYCMCTGNQFQEGRSWLERALALDDRGATAARGYALYCLATMAIHQGDYAMARAASTEALAQGRATAEPATIVGALFGLSSVSCNEGNIAMGLQYAAEALLAARAMDDAEWLVWTLWLQGTAFLTAGNLSAARSTFEEALSLSRQHSDRWCEADTLASLAFVVSDEGDFQRAAELHSAALTAYQGLGPGLGAPYSLIGVADLAAQLGRLEQATWLLAAAKAHFARFGYGSSQDLSQRSARIERTLRARFDDESFALVSHRGESLSIDDAVATALEVAAGLLAERASPLSA